MNTLIVCRHTRPEPGDPPTPDRKRRLTAAGRKDARAVGRELARRGLQPDLVLSSDSTRTRETTALICAELPREPEVRYLAELYSVSSDGLIETVETYGFDAAIVLIVGHNPGLEQLASRVAGFPLTLHPGSTAVLGLDGRGESRPLSVAEFHMDDLFDPPTR